MNFLLASLLLLLAPFPTLSAVAGSAPGWLWELLPLYFTSPFLLYQASRRSGLASLPLFGHLVRLEGKGRGAMAPLAAVSLPFLVYWGLAPALWSFRQAYLSWLVTAGVAVPLAVFLGFALGKHLPPVLLAGVSFLVFSLLSRLVRSLAPAGTLHR